jgi:hypothetical protein
MFNDNTTGMTDLKILEISSLSSAFRKEIHHQLLFAMFRGALPLLATGLV